MPSPNQLEDSIAAKVLSAAGSVGENADTLRRADGLTIRRLGWSLQLRHVETLARDLPLMNGKSSEKNFISLLITIYSDLIIYLLILVISQGYLVSL